MRFKLFQAMRSVILQSLVVFLSLAYTFGQQKKTLTTTISDPASVSLEALFAQADIVAFVAIRSGDSEYYNVAVYKAQVLKPYKGVKVDEVIYFAPFISYGVGSEYLVFLKKTGKDIGSLVTKENAGMVLPYDAKQAFYQIMYDGYSIMPVSFECVFGKPAHENCGWGVKFNTKQVKLPARLNRYPRINEDLEVLYERYVKRNEIESTLHSLQKSSL